MADSLAILNPAQELKQAQFEAEAAKIFATTIGNRKVGLDVRGAGNDPFTASHIAFPDGLGEDEHQPYFMVFKTRKITSAVGGTMGDTSFQDIGVEVGGTGGLVDQVALPIPTGIQTSYAQQWNQTDVNALQGGIMRTSAFGGAANLARRAAGGETTNMAEIGKKAMSGAQNVKGSAMGMASDIMAGGVAGATAGISGILNKIAHAGIGGNAVAGIALGTAGAVLGPAMSTATGFASFKQTMNHYSGPQFRTFGFNFSLKPLDEKDQNSILNIVNYFKLGAAPNQISAGLYRIYEIPYLFRIQFYSTTGEMTDINKIAHCALTNLQVTYGGDRFQTFAGTNSPVQTDIQLQFTEVELITRGEMEIGF